MSDEKYVGPVAAAKNVLLTKAALDKKLDKTGGTITGSLKVDGLINAGNSIDVKSDIDAEGHIYSGLALLAPTLGLNNAAEEASVSIDCSGDNAARITSLGSDGKSRYARLSVGTPTGDNDAATKAYVDSKSAVATTSTNGLMSAADKTKLDGVEAGANKTTVDAELDAASENPVQNKAVKAALDGKLSTLGGEISGYLEVGQTVSAKGSISVGRTSSDTGIHFEKAASNAGRISHGAAGVDDTVPLARLKVASPTEDDDAATKAYVDGRAAGSGAVRYDAAQTLDEAQQFQARKNIGALSRELPVTTGPVSLCPANVTDNNDAVHLTTTKYSGDDFTLTLDCGPENALVRVDGIRTPTDADTDAAANVEYVKAKISEVTDSGGVDVDNALSETSTNPVQNKVVTAALTGKASTAVATQSINGLMSKADKTKLDGIAAGATKVTIDSTVSGSSNNPVANRVIKQYVDDKVAAGINITVDAALSSTSTNPVQNRAVKAAIDAKADKTALDAKADKTALDDKMDKSGGTLTGNLTGKYITGTWLQTTDATDLGRVPGKIAVLDESGWVYYRTPAELLADLGADYIVSQGTTGSWTWRKWHSGIAEMWAIFEATSLAVNNAWGSVYYGTWMSVAANKAGRKYPFAFKGTPVVIATPYSPSTDFWLLTDSTNNVGTPQTYAPAYACVLPRSATITGPQIHYHVIGKYK